MDLDQLTAEQLTEIQGFAAEVYHDDVGYRGNDDAWVNAESIQRAIKNGGITVPQFLLNT
jgi:hypothetical protein